MNEINKVAAPNVKGYSDAGASKEKRALRGFIARSGAPAEDIDFNNKTLRQRGRMLYMASPVATAAINTNRTKIVGTGLHLKCAINRELLGLSESAADEWQVKTEAEFMLWAGDKYSCDALGINNLFSIEQLIMLSSLMSGDSIVLIKRENATPLRPYSLRLHVVEADRVSTPTKYRNGMFITEGVNKENGNEIHDGVEVNSSGKIVAYHICNVYPDQITSKKQEWKRVEAMGARTELPNVLHIMVSERPDQYRGVTYLAPVIEVLLQLRRYTESELMAALVQSFLTAWIVTETDNTEIPINEVNSGIEGSIPTDQPEPNDGISDSPDEYEMGPGTINHLAPGESVTLGNPNIPTAGFEPFLKTMCKLVGAALEIPYDVLLKEFNSSYSAAKGALEEAFEAFKMRRTWFVDDFCQPLYQIWLAEAVATGRIKAPGFFVDPRIRAAWSKANWNGPAQTHLDPLKEAEANEKIVAHGWKTNAQITRESYGGNWRENIEVVKRENEYFTPAQSVPTTPKEGGNNE